MRDTFALPALTLKITSTNKNLDTIFAVSLLFIAYTMYMVYTKLYISYF